MVEQINNTNGVALFYHHDQLGSTRMLTEVSGNTASTFSYSPYGTLTGSTGTRTTAFGFAGEYTDSETGFQYLRARYYDPQSAQFISRDPLGLASGETNLYGYAGRDPEDLVDPSGEFLCLRLSVSCYVNDVITVMPGAGTVKQTLDAAATITGHDVGSCIGGTVGVGPVGEGAICYVATRRAVTPVLLQLAGTTGTAPRTDYPEPSW